MADTYFPPIVELIRKEEYLANQQDYIPFDGSPINTDIYNRDQLRALRIPIVESRVVTPFSPTEPVNNQYRVISSTPRPNPHDGSMALAQFALQPFKTKDPLKPNEQFLSVENPGQPVYIGLVLHPEVPEKTLKGIRIIPRLPADGPVVGPNGFKMNSVVPTVYQLYGTHDDVSTVKDGDIDRLRWESVVDPTRMDPNEWEMGVPTEFDFPEEALELLKFKGFKLVFHEWDYSAAQATDSAPGLYKIDFQFVDDGNVVQAATIPAPEGYVYVANLKGVDITNKLQSLEQPKAPEIDLGLLANVLADNPIFYERSQSANNTQREAFQKELDSAKKHFESELKNYKEQMFIQTKNILDRFQAKLDKTIADLATKSEKLDQHEVMLLELKPKLEEMETKMTAQCEASEQEKPDQEAFTPPAAPAELDLTEIENKLAVKMYDLNDQSRQALSSFCAEQQFEINRLKDEALDELSSKFEELINNVPHVEASAAPVVGFPDTQAIIDDVMSRCDGFSKDISLKLDRLDRIITDMTEVNGTLNITNTSPNYDFTGNEQILIWNLFTPEKLDQPRTFTLDLSKKTETALTINNYCEEPVSVVISPGADKVINVLYNGRLIKNLTNLKLTSFGERIELVQHDDAWYGILSDGIKN